MRTAFYIFLIIFVGGALVTDLVGFRWHDAAVPTDLVSK